MDRKDLRKLLAAVKGGEQSLDEALETLATLPFKVLPDATLDTHRSVRTGYPEVVFGLGKTADQIARISLTLHDAGNNVLITKLDETRVAGLLQEFPVETVEWSPDAGCALVKHHPVEIVGRGAIGLVAAGTSDLPVAREAVFTARALGNEVREFYDVGVAGVHRLLHHHRALRECAVLIVVAGMEGALPSVVGGLVSAPLIAVPTSVGYGAAFGGIAALLGMLNSCSPGVTVVNIDNGFGAAYAASLINRGEQ
jgi:pyridinium-3,5-biscarboxylic acid mononucleotide synthase